MAGEYKIVKVNPQPSSEYDFNGDDGSKVYMQVFQCMLSGTGTPEWDPETQDVEVHRNRDQGPPEVGLELYGDVNVKPGKYGGLKFKRAARQGEGRQQTFSGGSKAGYRNPPTPEEQAAIRRGAAAKEVVPIVDQALTLSVAAQPKSWDEYWALYEAVLGKVESLLAAGDA